MPRRGRKNATTDNSIPIDDNNDAKSSSIPIKPVKKPRTVASKNKAAAKIEDDNDEESEEESEVERVRPHRNPRDSKPFDRAVYIKPRDTPMISSVQKREIQDMLVDDVSEEVDDNSESYYSDNNEDKPATSNDIIEILEGFQTKNNNLDLLAMMLMVNNISETIKLESSRLKTLGDNVDQLSKMITRHIKKSDTN